VATTRRQAQRITLTEDSRVLMFEVIYLFIDGLAERLHLGQPREAVLTAWGVLADRHKDETGNAFCGCSCGCGC
jgi:hypothetical protein